MVKTFILLFLTMLFAIPHGYGSNLSTPNEIAFSFLEKSVQFTNTYPDSSIVYAEKAIEEAIKTDVKQTLQDAFYQLGYVYYNQNYFTKSNENFHKALVIAVDRNDNAAQALTYNRIGNINQLQTNYLTALDYYKKALEINKELGNNAEIARTLVNLANVYSVVGQFQQSIEFFLQALDIHQSIGEREGLAWTSLGIARLFKRLDLLDRAMEYAQSALNYYREVEEETGKSVGVTLSLSEIGSIYHKLGKYNEALEHSELVLQINKKTGNVHGQAANHISLGVIFFDKDNNDLALDHLTKALEIKETVGDSLDLAPLYRHLGKVELQEGNIVLAQTYFNRSKDLAYKHRLIPDLSEAYLGLSEIFAQIGQSDKALAAYITHSNYKDSLNSSDISRLEMQYEFEKREKERELLAQQREALQEARLERQRVVLIFFIVGFVLTGALAAFIFYGYREKRRINLLLVEQNNEITRQKGEIENQKEEIEQQRDFVTRQRDKIANQQRLITDSITYASRIQNAILPSQKTLSKLPWNSFVFYKPKNIVSGDFYWVSKLSNGKILLVAADCTGHGVPGAFMSMLGITLLREIAGKDNPLSPAEMLIKLREMVILSLNQQPDIIEQSDGMDMALAQVNPNTLEVEFAGAYLSAIVVRKGKTSIDEQSKNPRVTTSGDLSLIEYRGDKMPIGHHILKSNPFSSQTFQLEKGDMLYLFSDGYIDQFGGEQNQKFLLYNFRKLLLSIFHEDLETQKTILNSTIEGYMGEEKQVDDMLVFGIKVD